MAECKRKRDQLDTYQKASRIVEKDALGSEKEYSADDRKKLIDSIQKQIAENCEDNANDAGSAEGAGAR